MFQAISSACHGYRVLDKAYSSIVLRTALITEGMGQSAYLSVNTLLDAGRHKTSAKLIFRLPLLMNHLVP